MIERYNLYDTNLLELLELFYEKRVLLAFDILLDGLHRVDGSTLGCGDGERCIELDAVVGVDPAEYGLLVGDVKIGLLCALAIHETSSNILVYTTESLPLREAVVRW